MRIEIHMFHLVAELAATNIPISMRQSSEAALYTRLATLLHQALRDDLATSLEYGMYHSFTVIYIMDEMEAVIL